MASSSTSVAAAAAEAEFLYFVHYAITTIRFSLLFSLIYHKIFFYSFMRPFRSQERNVHTREYPKGHLTRTKIAMQSSTQSERASESINRGVFVAADRKKYANLKITFYAPFCESFDTQTLSITRRFFQATKLSLNIYPSR